MPTIKIEDPGTLPTLCKHPDHEPAKQRVFEPGVWRHICPACSHSTMFRIDRVLLETPPPKQLEAMRPGCSIIQDGGDVPPLISARRGCPCLNGCKSWACDK